MFARISFSIDRKLHSFSHTGRNFHFHDFFSAVNSNFSVKDLLLPIPYNERILNPEGLYQNPGYGVE